MERRPLSSSSSSSCASFVAVETLEQLSRSGSAHASRGLDYDELGDLRTAARCYADALAFFGRALELRPAPPEARTLLDKVASNAALVRERLEAIPMEHRVPQQQQVPIQQHQLQPKQSFDSTQPSLLDRVTNLLIPKPAKTPTAVATQDWVAIDPPAFAPPPVVKISQQPVKSAPRPPSAPPTKEPADESLLMGVDKATQKRILDVAVDKSPGISWSDISGLDTAKRALYEVVILPSLRPDLFTGLTKPASGVLLFGPPGCGKTMLAKAVASESKTAFFSISASSLMSKYLGESESLVKGLFAVARYVAPSVVFIDEIDSLLSERSDNEHEASRRVKTEFLVQWDGITSGSDKRVLVMGATNRPFDLDEAALRRMPQRIYIPLPDAATRKQTLLKLLTGTGTKAQLSGDDLDWIVEKTSGYSQSDMKNLCGQAAMEPLRELSGSAILTVKRDAIRGVIRRDFEVALNFARPSVDSGTLTRLEEFARKFGMQ